MPADVVVIGIGNELRGDDAAGPLVMRQLRDAGLEVTTCADSADLLHLWDGARTAIVVDAIVTGAPAGTVHRLDLGSESASGSGGLSGTHSVGVGDAVELARALGRLPPRVIVYGIEAGGFALGAPSSGAVNAAIRLVAQRVRDEVALSA